MSSGHDHGSQQEVLREIRRNELALFIPLGLTPIALFTLGYAVWLYLQGSHLFAGVMTGLGASSIALLVLSRHISREKPFPAQLLFGLQMVLIGQLVLVYCPVGEVGVIGVFITIVPLIVVCGYRLGSILLLVNLLILLALFKGLLPFQVDQYSPDMVRGLLFGSSSVGLFLLVVNYYRERSNSQLVGETQKFSMIASQDELSGLPNRREMEKLLGNSINRYHLSGEVFSILVSDIDNFKHFNDSFGHQFGDRLVKAASGALQRGLRSTDVVARWGGDEFLVLLGGQSIEAAQQVAERLRRNVASLQLEASGEIQNVTMSFGLACISGHDGADDLISTADRGLYQAKQMGRDMVITG